MVFGPTRRQYVPSDIFTGPIGETFRGLDDLLASGKVRYIGFSDLRARKVSEAQTSAHPERGATAVPASRRLC
jgi:aryl-alcohol dehydrogenase-like predicted oxidoreductase